MATSQILIRPAVIADVYAIAAHMRAADAAEATVLGKDPRRALRTSFRSSLTPCKVALIDGKPAAIWGLGGDVISEQGAPWLVTTPAVERVPVSFLRIGRAELVLMLEVKPRLENYVAADYAKAVRFLQVLGFNLDAPVPLGPKRALFQRFWIEA